MVMSTLVSPTECGGRLGPAIQDIVAGVLIQTVTGATTGDSREPAPILVTVRPDILFNTINHVILETYRGPRAFSEPETEAVKNFILDRKNDIRMYLTLHSYGQMFLYPWGYDRVDHNREYELKRMGNIGARAMGRGYTVGSAAKVNKLLASSVINQGIKIHKLLHFAGPVSCCWRK